MENRREDDETRDLLDAFLGTNLGATALRCFLLVLQEWPEPYKPNLSELGRRFGITSQAVGQVFKQLIEKGIVFGDDAGLVPITDTSGWTMSGRAAKLREVAKARRPWEQRPSPLKDELSKSERRSFDEARELKDDLSAEDEPDERASFSESAGLKDGLSTVPRIRTGANSGSGIKAVGIKAEGGGVARNGMPIGPGKESARAADDLWSRDPDDPEVTRLAEFAERSIPGLGLATSVRIWAQDGTYPLDWIAAAIWHFARLPVGHWQRPHTNAKPLLNRLNDWCKIGGPAPAERAPDDYDSPGAFERTPVPPPPNSRAVAPRPGDYNVDAETDDAIATIKRNRRLASREGNAHAS